MSKTQSLFVKKLSKSTPKVHPIRIATIVPWITASQSIIFCSGALRQVRDLTIA